MHDDNQTKPKETETPTCGKIIKGNFFLRQHVGDATAPDGKKFEIATTLNGAPLIVYHNKAYSLSWEDICNMAANAGLFEED